MRWQPWSTESKVQKSLGDADAVEPMLQRQQDQRVPLRPTGARDVGAHALSVLTVAVTLASLDRVARVTVAAGDPHRLTVLCSQGLNAIHEQRLHSVASGVLARELRGSEVGVSGPVDHGHIFET